MTKSNLHLAWDIEQSQVIINDVAIVIVADNLAPDDVAAVVEEQDTALVLGKPSKITVSDEQPSWVLANKLESQDELDPGSVIIRDNKTIKLLAVVHDLSQDPSWKAKWIEKAMNNIFNISNSYGIRSIKLPILGAQYGRYPMEDFLSLLAQRILQHSASFEKIWLVVPKENCQQAISYLKEIDKIKK